MELLPTKLIEKDGEWYQVQKLPHKPNLDHIETVSGSVNEYYTYSELADTRKARPQQRRLFFALLSDVAEWSIVPQDFLKSMFYLQYQIYTDGKQISLSDVTQSSVSDANQLLDLVIDFMFEWHVPFNKGYKLLPREQEYYLFQCCRHRVCMICGNRADIHHVDVIGAGLNRTHVDHTKRHVMALCRVHHSEIEQIGSVAFSAKYHVPVDGIKLDKETLKRIGLKGKYSSD
ncbi:putative HNHc nuclease [Lactiplantibacillus plantarum]|uniref:putative HNHc nuclease n=1 Tax=Lactiplantibacillus plantarum TaxID=1590 RepID=UPI0028FC1150|nr:putative HNHc nuclease [Lactiplantibacillus plantarum]WNW16703.1 putative HNHc nuclease [Lactiplantibacillus plantarum]WNW19677.1 putative HNHc nuclease [Lactiplantibacillus plantarum]